MQYKKLILLLKKIPSILSLTDKISSTLSMPRWLVKSILYVIGVVLLWIVHILKILKDLILHVYYLSIWQIPIDLKLWQILILLIISFFILRYIFKRYNKSKKNLIEKYNNLNNIINKLENENTKYSDNLKKHLIEHNEFQWYEGKDIKWRWSYNKFNQVIVDFPPFCINDNVKLQFKDDKHVPAQDFICPICSQEKQLKEIYSKYRSTKKYLKSKYEKLSYFNTMRKANISIDDNLIEKV